MKLRKSLVGQGIASALSFIIVVIFLLPLKASAVVLYQQDSGADSVIITGVTFGSLGSFVPSSNIVITSNSYVSLTASSSNHLQTYNFFISSTTDISTSFGNFGPFTIPEGFNFLYSNWQNADTTLIAGHTYYVGSFASGDVIEFKSDYGGNFMGQIVSTLADLNLQQTTRFTEVIPANEETVSSTTDFSYGAGLWITPQDFEEGDYVRVRYVKNVNLQTAVSNTNLLWKEVDFDNDGIGFTSGFNFIFATTTALEDGQYTMEWTLRRKGFLNSIASWWGLNNLFGTEIVVSTSTQFIVGARSSFDELMHNTQVGLNNFVASSTLALQDVKNYCSFSTSFSFVDCLSALFLPNFQDIRNVFDRLNDTLFTYAPVGYVRRFIEIATQTSTSTLPTISYTFPNVYPFNQLGGVGGSNFHFNPWPYMNMNATGTPLHDTKSLGDDPKNIWEIMEPFYKIVVYLGLIFMIVHDLTNIHKNGNEKKQTKNL